MYEHVWLTIRSRLWYHAQVCVKKIDYSETKKEKNISSSEYRVNNSIRVPQVRLIDAGGEKEREARKAQVKIEIKEIRLRPKTTEHHRGFKVRDARRWLGQGKKVKVRIRFRGREITYPEIALNDLKEIAEELSDVSVVEQSPSLEGNSMLMVLAPGKTKKE